MKNIFYNGKDAQNLRFARALSAEQKEKLVFVHIEINISEAETVFAGKNCGNRIKPQRALRRRRFYQNSSHKYAKAFGVLA